MSEWCEAAAEWDHDWRDDNEPGGRRRAVCGECGFSVLDATAAELRGHEVTT